MNAADFMLFLTACLLAGVAIGRCIVKGGATR